MEIRDVVARIIHAFHGSLIDAVLDHHCGKRSPRYERLSDNDVSPRGRHTIRPNANLDAMGMHRPIVTTAHIVLSCPDKFDWRVAKALCDYCCLARHV